MTRGQFERAAYLKDEIDRFSEESQGLYTPNAGISIRIITKDCITSIAVTDELLDIIKKWYDKKVAALEAEFNEL